jgi:hypothetical protein
VVTEARASLDWRVKLLSAQKQSAAEQNAALLARMRIEAEEAEAPNGVVYRKVRCSKCGRHLFDVAIPEEIPAQIDVYVRKRCTYKDCNKRMRVEHRYGEFTG